MEDVTAAQAAVLTGLSERTIRRRIGRGELRARRIAPNRFAISVSDLPTPPEPTVVSRLDGLEQRVRVLELKHRLLLQHIERSVGSEQVAYVDADLTDATELRTLLDQLLRETELLAPLLASPSEAAKRPRSARTTRAAQH